MRVHQETIKLIVHDYQSTEAARQAQIGWWVGEGLTFSAVINRIGAQICSASDIHISAD